MTNRISDLGDRVRHIVTGFEGIVTSTSNHLAGCDQRWVEPKVDKDGKPMDGKWVDVDLLKIIEPNVVDAIKYDRIAPGGIDLPAPTRTHD